MSKKQIIKYETLRDICDAIRSVGNMSGTIKGSNLTTSLQSSIARLNAISSKNNCLRHMTPLILQQTATKWYIEDSEYVDPDDYYFSRGDLSNSSYSAGNYCAIRSSQGVTGNGGHMKINLEMGNPFLAVKFFIHLRYTYTSNTTTSGSKAFVKTVTVYPWEVDETGCVTKFLNSHDARVNVTSWSTPTLYGVKFIPCDI